MNKNIPDDYIALSEHICEICGVTHTHNTEVLIHRNLRSIPEDKRVTGFGLCKEHDELNQKGYLALIGVSNAEGLNKSKDRLKMQEAERTGECIHIRRNVFHDIFDTVVEDHIKMVFVTPDVITHLTKLTEGLEDE